MEAGTNFKKGKMKRITKREGENSGRGRRGKSGEGRQRGSKIEKEENPGTNTGKGRREVWGHHVRQYDVREF